MCGICGELRFDAAAPVEPRILQAMASALHHRGPDDQGFHLATGVGLGMRRLSVIDLAGGHQPVYNEDRTCCIVYNGEIYNFLDLRPHLAARGHIFQTRSDTEVVLHGYEEWGVDCFKHLNGMFALAIWDDRRHSLLLARDRVGEKPLYYYRSSHRLVFASEIKGILADPTVPRQLHPRGLVNFLAFGHSVAPETIYKDIFKLLPGHYLIAKESDIQTIQYWDVGDEPHLAWREHETDADYAEQVFSLLDDSVRRRMVADVPVGAFLSGGVDSSAIVALMKRYATGPVKTFSLGFTVGGAYNELSAARRVATYLGTEHYQLRVDHLDLVKTLHKLIYHYDEPFGDAAGFPVYLLSQFAREQVKVVLTGDGGDELFGGYRRYAADQLAPLYQRLPAILTRQLLPRVAEALPRLRRIKRALRALPISDPALRYATWLLVFTDDMWGELLQPDVLDGLIGYEPASSYPRHYNRRVNRRGPVDHLNQLMYVDLKTWLADAYLEKMDKATMAVSLEGRMPILDHRLVELAFQIPSRYKIQGRSTKVIFKHAVSALLPPDVLHRAKHGFAVPTDPWFRGPLKDFTFDVLMDGRTRCRGYFKPTVIERLWREHVAGSRVWDAQLWLLLNFELWARTFLDGTL